ncbi:MAG: hypothetical protein M1817_006799 [Caeruleum heppii]|nr:MAG: hypothetical protein M1817_006799 [Caeruleum heppii]
MARHQRREVIFSRGEIENLIAEGRKVIIVDGKVLKVDPWLKYHPGGDTAILHMVGRDATDEVNALHSREARQRMNKYIIGSIKGRWENFLPPIQGGRFRTMQQQSVDVYDPSDSETSSVESRSSRSTSSLFECSQEHTSSVKHRWTKRTSSVSSLSSISSTEISKPVLSRPSHLDLRTRQEIDLDLSRYPPLDPDTQQNIILRYRQLNDEIRAAGLYQCNYTAYASEIARYLLLFSLSMLLLHLGWYGTSGLCLGFFWHLLVFTAHDAGHMGITHSFTIDTIIGILIADFLGGLSLGWWKRNHNVHHVVTNSPEHDPDIEHMPFFAVSHRFLDSLRSTYYDRIMTYDPLAKFVIRYQHYLYYPVLTLGRFNLYRLSWVYLLLGQAPKRGPAWWTRYLELAGQVVFWIWFGYFLLYRSIPTAASRILFILCSHMVTMPLHVQITLSHFGMSTSTLPPSESFPQKMLRTTMDVDCPAWMDFLHGGLQFQAVHHLYPRIPRHNLREVSKMVETFSRDTGVPYVRYGFLEGNQVVLGRLGEVARFAEIYGTVQREVGRKMAEEGLGSH